MHYHVLVEKVNLRKPKAWNGQVKEKNKWPYNTSGKKLRITSAVIKTPISSSLNFSSKISCKQIQKAETEGLGNIFQSYSHRLPDGHALLMPSKPWRNPHWIAAIPRQECWIHQETTDTVDLHYWRNYLGQQAFIEALRVTCQTTNQIIKTPYQQWTAFPDKMGCIWCKNMVWG